MKSKPIVFLFLFFIIAMVVATFFKMYKIEQYIDVGGRYYVPQYEGFQSLRPLKYSTYDNDNNAIDNGNAMMINQQDSNCNKLWGFGSDGLFCKPYLTDNNIDIYSGLRGSLDCPEIPYTNYGGYLCLDEKRTKLLSSRGGNAGFRDSEIGK